MAAIVLLRRRLPALALGALLLGCTPSPSASASPTATSTGSAGPSATGTPRSTASSAATGSVVPSATPSTAVIPGTTVHLEPVVTGLTDPLDIAPALDGSGRLFIAEQAGVVRIVRDGALVAQPYLDIRSRILAGGERGLLGIALHPGFPNDSRIFVDYTDLHGDTVVSSFDGSLDADSADPESERVILRVKQPFANHNGGAIQFGADGQLYIALGDGGSGGDPQGNGRSLKTLLAKILRIDVDVPAGTSPAYTIPPTNPWAIGAGGARPEIWLTGLRNPWRMRFDRPTGDLWIGDVGQAAWEEIDVVRAGQQGLDFGWNTMEGFHCYQPSTGCDETGLTLPIAEYGHDQGCAVIGGAVIRDPSQPSIDGRYVFSDSCSGNLWLIDPAAPGPQTPTLVGRTSASPSAIALDANGVPLLADLRSGALDRIVAGPGPAAYASRGVTR